MKINFITPNKTREFITACLNVGLVPFVRSSPGCGKSEIIKAIAEEQGLKVIDFRLSTADITDLNGLPHFVKKGEKEIATFSPFDTFPTELDSIPEGYKGWLLFLDEFNSASQEVQAAAYRVVLDREIGQYRLHPECRICCAGNLDTDRAITNDLSSAMTSRLVSIYMKVDFDEWLENVALPRDYDPLLIAYLECNKADLNNFNPDIYEGETFACPRTYDFMNRLLKSGVNDPDLFTGVVGHEVATKFRYFCEVKDQIIKVEDIIKNPKKCRLPKDVGISWLTITNMLNELNADNFEALSIYLDRFEDNSFKFLFYKSIRFRNPELLKHRLFAKKTKELLKRL